MYRNKKNKLGIAAGLDKNGDYIDCFGSFGLGFIEVGTVTPRSSNMVIQNQEFLEIKKKKLLLNRLGFNNKGVDYLFKQLKKKKLNNCYWFKYRKKL